MPFRDSGFSRKSHVLPPVADFCQDAPAKIGYSASRWHRAAAVPALARAGWLLVSPLRRGAITAQPQVLDDRGLCDRTRRSPFGHRPLEPPADRRRAGHLARHGRADRRGQNPLHRPCISRRSLHSEQDSRHPVRRLRCARDRIAMPGLSGAPSDPPRRRLGGVAGNQLATGGPGPPPRGRTPLPEGPESTGDDRCSVGMCLCQV